MLLTRTRIWLIGGVAALAVLGWFAGLGILPLAAVTIVALAVILLTPRRIPVRDRAALGDLDDGRDLTRFGWGHPMASSMLIGAAVFGWFNGTGGRDSAGDGLGGAGGFDGSGGGGDFGGGDVGGGGGVE